MKHKQFEDYLRSGTANNITVGVLAVIGLICGAKSFTGTQISLVEYCFIPETLTNPVNRLRYCTQDLRYIMPESEFNAEVYAPANPEFQRDSFLPTKATRLRIIPPSNPDKPWWGLASVFVIGGAYGLSKAREWRLLQLIPELREEIRSNWLIAKLREGLRLHKESYTAQLDYEFHQWSENRRVRAAQLSKMTPEELAIFQEQVRLKAEAEARAQLQQATGQPAGALPGQSMQDIARGDDKVTGEQQQALQQNTPGSLHPSEALALNTLQALAKADSSTALVAAPGSGKSVTLNYLIGKILADSPNADIWVISAKNDSFCGLREKERVIVFDQENPDLAKVVIDNFYLTYKQRKQLPESKRESLPPLILILDDWLVIADSLSKLYSDWNYGSKLLDVLLIGREFNTKFIASLQSFNLAALGIEKMDAQTRLCLNLLLLGNKYIKNSREQESYGVLELILNRGDIIPGKQEREQIKSKYLEIKTVSYQNFRPVMIASVGGFVVALMPNLSNQAKSITSEQEYLDRVFDMEFNLTAAHHHHPKPLSEVAKKIYEYFQNVKNKTPKTLRDLKKADRLSGYSDQELIDGLAELVKSKRINSDGNDSYSLPDW
ncbi:type IV secretory system conjugative DNA transfer family protein [Dendronalium sp. ChiSLP03b]|uniref:type IV secretory system conjugative DNA transfer family protein n=1 Tax=Dendronalium sp. ChiSLP03b TaxID=3075381 RepID=UPI00391AE5D1